MANVKGFARKQPITEAPTVEAIATALAERISPEFALSQVRMTFGDLFNKWLTDYANVHMSPPSVRNYIYRFHKHLACWKDMKLGDIRRADVAAWTARLSENISPTSANRSRELMRMIFNWAFSIDLLPGDYNPAAKIRKFTLQPRERFLSADELPRFFAAVQTVRYSTTRDLILMLLLTAQRRGNVMQMRFDQIDWTRKVWTIPGVRNYGPVSTRTKTGSSYVVPLVADAVVILARRKATATSEWVFPAKGNPDQPTSDITRAWRSVCEKAGIHDLRIHDLRRTHASWQALMGENLVAIQRTLNHSDIRSTSIYAKLNVDAQRQAMNTASRAMMQAAGVPASKFATETAALPHLGPGFDLMIDDPWITEKDAATLADMRVEQLQQLRLKGRGPAHLKEGFSIKYKAHAVLAWMHGRDNQEGSRP